MFLIKCNVTLKFTVLIAESIPNYILISRKVVFKYAIIFFVNSYYHGFCMALRIVFCFYKFEFPYRISYMRDPIFFFNLQFIVEFSHFIYVHLQYMHIMVNISHILLHIFSEAFRVHKGFLFSIICIFHTHLLF